VGGHGEAAIGHQAAEEDIAKAGGVIESAGGDVIHHLIRLSEKWGQSRQAPFFWVC
jgi:hypothetical protein